MSAHVDDSLARRVFWLYGIHSLLGNLSFVVGYYWLPEGAMRSTPWIASGYLVARWTEFWPQFAATLAFNLILGAGLGMACNLQQVRGFPAGYVLPMIVGVIGGLTAGSNSFAADDLSRYNVRQGMAMALTIGGLEMLGYICVIAATVNLGIYHYRSWWRWGKAWKPTKLALRDVRFSRQEVWVIGLGLLLIVLGAYRETQQALRHS